MEIENSLTLPPRFQWLRQKDRLLAARESEMPALLQSFLWQDQTRNPRKESSKHQGRRQLWQIPLQNSVGLVRPLAHGGLLRFLFGEYFVDWKRPFEELVLTEKIRDLGIATPEPIAAAAIGRPGAWQLYYVSREIAGENLVEFLRRQTNQEKRRMVLMQVGQLIRTLHDRGILHQDLHLKNLFITSDLHKVYLLDLDRLIIVSQIGEQTKIHNLARLWRYPKRHKFLYAQEIWTHADFHSLLQGYDPGRIHELQQAIRLAYAVSAPFHYLGWIFEKFFSRPKPKPSKD